MFLTSSPSKSTFSVSAPTEPEEPFLKSIEPLKSLEASSFNASFEIVQVFVGRGSLYDGIRTELIGNNSAFTADIGYLGAKKQNIDINLISNHIGKKTNSGIRVDGAYIPE